MEIKLGSSTPLQIGTARAYPMAIDVLIVRETEEAEGERLELTEGREFVIGGVHWVFKRVATGEKRDNYAPPGSFHHVASLISVD